MDTPCKNNSNNKKPTNNKKLKEEYYLVDRIEKVIDASVIAKLIMREENDV